MWNKFWRDFVNHGDAVDSTVIPAQAGIQGK